jgi:2-polyprenyl-6-methoxyphenol hydroxylase-like FAD-dependent oxidoreductase
MFPVPLLTLHAFGINGVPNNCLGGRRYALIETPVLIVGGGAVGLALAVDLGWRGVQCVLIEREGPDARREHLRHDNVGVRTMEIARRWGIVPAIEHAGFPRDLPLSIVYTTGVLSYELARDEAPPKESARQLPFSPQRHELCPQNFFDPVIQQSAAAYAGNRLLHRHELVEFTDRGDHVDATVRAVESGELLQIRAQYLVGCDGASSAVAQRLGLSTSVNQVLSCSTNIFVHCPALRERTADRRGYRYLLVGPEGMWGSMVNISGRDVWRLQLLGDNTWPEWTPEQIDGFIRRGIGADVPFEVVNWVPWSRREIVADHFRSGRCFLAGDAIHQLSPTGGYGMNTGIAEAVDLAWKLDGVLSGWGGDKLLDSYEAERHPIAERNVKQASENLGAMRSIPPTPDLMAPGPEGDAIRASVGAFTQKVMQREWRSFGIHLGMIYKDSPVIAYDGPHCPEQDVAQFTQRACVGGRAPHAWLSPCQSTLDLFGRGFVLVECGPSDGLAPVQPLLAAAQAVGLPLRYVSLADPEVLKLYEKRYTLVRPDGHIAWHGDAAPKDPGALVDRVRGAA